MRHRSHPTFPDQAFDELRGKIVPFAEQVAEIRLERLLTRLPRLSVPEEKKWNADGPEAKELRHSNRSPIVDDNLVNPFFQRD